MENPRVLQQKAQSAISGNRYTLHPELNKVQTEEKQANNNVGVRSVATVGNLFKNIVEGAIDTLEGLVDAGAMTVGLFGDGAFKDDISSFVEYDFTADIFGEDGDEGILDWTWGKVLENNSYLDDNNFVNQIGYGVGGMLPSVAINLIPGVGPALSTATFIAGAGGNATEDALKEGASYNSALAYGALAGTIEGVTEKIGGRAFGETAKLSNSWVGKFLQKKGLDKFVSKGAGKVAFNFVSEGTEEVLSDLLNPLAKRVTGVDKNATVDFGKLPETFLVGGATGVVMDGLQSYAGALRNKDKGGKKYVNILEDIENIQSTLGAQELIQGSKKYSQEKVDEIGTRANTRIYNALSDISNNLKAMNESERIEAINSINSSGTILADMFDGEGNLSEEVSSTIQEAIANKKVGNYSAGMFSKEKEIDAFLVQQGFKRDTSTFNEQERTNYALSEKALQAISEKTGEKVNLVITETNKKYNAFFHNNTVYATKEQLTNGTWAKALAHEVTHFAEKSLGYKNFADLLIEDKKALEKATNTVIRNYEEVTKEVADSALSKVASGEALTKAEDTAYSEIIASLTENLLGNEESINRIVRSNRGLAQKIYNKIKDVINALQETNADTETRQRLNMAEKLFSKALSDIKEQHKNAEKEAKKLVKIGAVINAFDKKDNNEKTLEVEKDYKGEVDVQEEIQYNRKAFSFQHKNFPGEKETGSEAHRLAIWWTKCQGVIAGDQTLISMNDRWYLVEKFDDADNGYQVEEVLTQIQYNEFVKEWDNGKNRTKQSVQRSVSRLTSLNKRRNTVRGEEHSVDSLQTQHGRQDNSIQRVGEKESQRRQTYSNGRGNSEGGGANKQSLNKRKFSLKEKTDFISVTQIKKYYDKAISEAYQEYRKVDPYAIGRYADKQECVEAFKLYLAQQQQLETEKEAVIDNFTKKNSLKADTYLSDDIEEEVLKKFGSTYSWRETGYILTDGSKLDLSGKKQGSRGGYRSVDHRDIFDDYDMDSTKAMIEFMSLGNIRVSPENPGINIQIEPNDEQYRLIQDMVEKLGWNDEYFSVDFDNEKGNTIDSLSYEGKVSGRKVVSDIKYYFKNGEVPRQSEISKFRYSLKPVSPVKPSNENWSTTINTDEALKRFPNLWNVKAEASEVRNPTQIKGTVSTYRKIFEILKDERFGGRILDASSGLGYGTKAGIDEYGFNIDDIEPYPDGKYKPKYTDYASLKEKYEVIISNAVLNVLPQDQRDALIVKMGELLKVGGRLFVNVRGDDVNNLSSNPKNVKISENEWYVAPTGSYQKGFTKSELVAYIKDALGENYGVNSTTLFGKTSAIVTKLYESRKFSLKNSNGDTLNENQVEFFKDSEGNTLSEQQVEFFKDSKVRDENGNLLVVYHGTLAKELNTFDPKRVGERYSYDERGFFFIDRKTIAEDYSRSEFSSTDKGIVIPCYILGKKPLVIDSDYLKKNEYPWDCFKKDDCIGFWDNYQSAILDDFDEYKADSILIDDGDSKMVVAFKPNQIKRTTNLSPTFLNDIRFSRKPFAEQVDKALDGNLPKGDSVLVSEHTPKMIIEVGFSDLPMLVTQKHLKDINTPESTIGKGNYHGLSRKQIKRLPELLENPVMIFDSMTDPQSIVAVTDMIDDKGRPVIVAVKADGSAKYLGIRIDSNFVTSFYGKNGFASFVLKHINNKKLLIWNKEKSHTLYRDLRVQFPQGLYKYDSNTIIRKTNAKINTFDEKSLKFSKKQSANEIKSRANLMQDVVYGKKQSYDFVNEIIMETGEKVDEIYDGRYDIILNEKGKLAETIFEDLNKANKNERLKIALSLTDYILDSISVQEVLDKDIVKASEETLKELRQYLHKIDFSGCGSSHSISNGMRLLWGKNKNTEVSYTPDRIAELLKEKGIEIKSTNTYDILEEIHNLYKSSLLSIRKTAKQAITKVFGEKELREIKETITNSVIDLAESQGTTSKVETLINNLRQSYDEKVESLKKALSDTHLSNHIRNRILYKVQKFKDIKIGTYNNATQAYGKELNKLLQQLSKIKNSGNFNKSGTRKAFAQLLEWYSKGNPLLEYNSKENAGLYNEEIATLLELIANNEKPLTKEQEVILSNLEKQSGLTDYDKLRDWYTVKNIGASYNSNVKKLLSELSNEQLFNLDELIAIDNITSYFEHFVKNFNKVLKNGKYVEAKPLASDYLDTIKENKKVKVGFLDAKVVNWYIDRFADPATVGRRHDKYAEKGFFTESILELRKAATMAEITNLEIREPLEKFYKANKKYKKTLLREVNYGDAKITVRQAMQIYMTLKRQQAIAGLAFSGFTVVDKKGKTQRIDGFANAEMTNEELEQQVKTIQEMLFSQFSKEDKEYIKIAEDIFNNQCKEIKRQTDITRQGYSNIIDDYYIPISRAFISKNVDSFYEEMDRVSNASFNKETVKGAKNELAIDGLDLILERHIKGISQYACIAIPIENFNRLFNLNLGDNVGKPISIRTESENEWKDGYQYITKLISDIQGISAQRDKSFSKIFGTVRKGFAKAQLGANPKVWFTQLSSVFASLNILDVSSLAQGMFIKTSDEELDKYCKLAKLRNFENTAALAQGVYNPAINNIDAFTDKLMTPIGKVDRAVIKMLFGACQVQIAKYQGIEIGTEENKIKAGELLETVIFETQQNSMATERSLAMRSSSEIVKSLTMFSADAMKGIGRFIDAFGKVQVLKAKIKIAGDITSKEQLQKELQKAKKQLRKTTGACVSTAIVMALIAQGFRWLYNKDEEEDIGTVMVEDVLGNLLGGLPIVKEVYSYLVEGYEVDNYVYSSANNFLKSMSNLGKAVDDLCTNGVASQSLPKSIRDLIYSSGQLFGIPIRNMYNFTYGITKRLSPTTAYKINSIFYKPQSSDIKKALEKGDMGLASACVQGVMAQKGLNISNEQAKLFAQLYAEGYSLPSGVPKTITINDEEVELSVKQQLAISKIYDEGTEIAEEAINRGLLKGKTKATQAKTLSYIYKYFYYEAQSQAMNIAVDNKLYMFGNVIPIAKMAVVLAEVPELVEGKTYKKSIIQRYIQRQNLTQAQKYMLMGYLGYTNTYGENVVKAQINRSSLSKAQKQALLEKCGY